MQLGYSSPIFSAIQRRRLTEFISIYECHQILQLKAQKAAGKSEIWYIVELKMGVSCCLGTSFSLSLTTSKPKLNSVKLVLIDIDNFSIGCTNDAHWSDWKRQFGVTFRRKEMQLNRNIRSNGATTLEKWQWKLTGWNVTKGNAADSVQNGDFEWAIFHAKQQRRNWRNRGTKDKKKWSRAWGRGVQNSKQTQKKRSTFRQNNEHRFGVGFPGTKLQLNSIDLNFGLGRFSYFRAYSQGSVPR